MSGLRSAYISMPRLAAGSMRVDFHLEKQDVFAREQPPLTHLHSHYWWISGQLCHVERRSSHNSKSSPAKFLSNY